jgi:hypothetical protein
MAWIDCAWQWITDHATVLATVVSALSAIAVAVFTVCLARVTGRLAALTNEALITTERAFVYLDGFEVDLAQRANPQDHNDPLFITRFVVKPRWRNSGNTPAKSLSIRVNFTVTMGNFPVNYQYGGAPEALFIGPNGVEFSSFHQFPGGSAETLVGRHEAGQTDIFIWGRADYEDIFPGTEPHFTQWCYRAHLSAPDGKILRADFVQSGDYNSSD